MREHERFVTPTYFDVEAMTAVTVAALGSAVVDTAKWNISQDPKERCPSRGGL